MTGGINFSNIEWKLIALPPKFWQTWSTNILRINRKGLYVLVIHVCVSERIHTPWLPECQGTLCSKQVQNLKFKGLQLDSNPQPLSLSPVAVT